MGKGREQYVRPRHRGSQWLVFCDLFADKGKEIGYQLWLSYDQKCSTCPFRKRTSEVQLPLFERVEVREGVLDEIRRHAHHLGGGRGFTSLFCSGVRVGGVVDRLSSI